MNGELVGDKCKLEKQIRKQLIAFLFFFSFNKAIDHFLIYTKFSGNQVNSSMTFLLPQCIVYTSLKDNTGSPAFRFRFSKIQIL
jgi:hypothetical protein